jgi:hypothetical protein
LDDLDNEYEKAFREFSVELPELENKLAELEKIQPEDMAARREKITSIKQLKSRIAEIKGSPIDPNDIPPWEAFDDPNPSQTIKREYNKQKTQEMYRDWQKEYKKIKKEHPNLSNSDIARRIAKMDIAKGKSERTIRAHMKS